VAVQRESLACANANNTQDPALLFLTIATRVPEPCKGATCWMPPIRRWCCSRRVTHFAMNYESTMRDFYDSVSETRRLSHNMLPGSWTRNTHCSAQNIHPVTARRQIPQRCEALKNRCFDFPGEENRAAQSIQTLTQPLLEGSSSV